MWEDKVLHYGANATNRPPLWHKSPEGQNQTQERPNQSDSNGTAWTAARNLK